MTSNLNRRDFGRLLAGGAAASTLASVGSFAAAADSVRLIWWGNPDRDRRTNEVIALYTKDKGPRSRPRPTAGTTTGRSSPPRRRARTCPT